MDPVERRRVRVRARSQALSAERSALINQRRREAYHAKKPSAGVEDLGKKAKRNQHDREAYHAKKKEQQMPAVRGRPKSGAERKRFLRKRQKEY
jgi:hypothetical protein